MIDYAKAIVTLERSRDELINSIVESGASGGTGRSQQYAPVLMNICGAIEAIRDLMDTSEGKPTLTPAERMAAVRAAKQNK